VHRICLRGAGCDRWAYRAHHRFEAGAGKDRNHESRVQYQTLRAAAASGVYVRNGIKSWISEGKPRLKRAFGFVRLSHSVACPMLPVSHRRRQCDSALFVSTSMRQMIDNTLFTSRQARSLHYQRHIEPEGEDSLARLLRLIPKGTSVLELGPATGYCSRYLHEALGCTVDAVELSAERIMRFGDTDDST
jgi:hypothetical protein